MDKIRYLQIRTRKCENGKVAEIQRLYSKWLWLLMAVSKPSLADAKVLKDILQYHIICHFSCNIGNEEDTFTYVL